VLTAIQWVGKTCGAPEINFDPFQVFSTLTQFPDEGAVSGASIGCKRKNKSACKNPREISGTWLTRDTEE